jgi:hypothetical protein
MFCYSFYVLLSSPFRYFVEKFCEYIHEGYWSIFLLFVLSWSDFGIVVIPNSISVETKEQSRVE